jgi:hypothetical protein
MSKQPQPGEYSPEETQRRFDAALSGARMAGPQHKQSLTPKPRKAQRPKSKKAR